jgi:hypothetical protein
MNWSGDLLRAAVDPKDPNPWQALYLDRSVPIHDAAKLALLRGQNTWSRRVVLPLMRPIARLFIVLVQLLRFVIPSRWNSSRVLHLTIYWGLKYCVARDANYLILRHFNIGTELLRFIADNAGVDIHSTIGLRPKKLEDLIDDTFLIHDLNIFNFLIELNTALQAQGRELSAPAQINFDAITDGEFDIDPGLQRWSNILDIQTAIELYTPLYALFLTDHDFWRASNSLQLDEPISIYMSKLLNDPTALALVSNRHPMVPVSTLQAGFRLMLHGLDAELLHGYLRALKRQALGESA